MFGQRFPSAFGEDGSSDKPLKIGIDKELFAAFPDIPRGHIKKALSHHTLRYVYLLSLARGLYRRDLDGSKVEKVSAEHAAFAKLIIDARRAGHKRIAAEKRAAKRGRTVLRLKAPSDQVSA
jgi:ProP effector